MQGFQILQQPQVPQFSQPTSAFDALIEIRTDLYLANHALHHESEMPENERGGAYYSIQRILRRMDEVIDKTADQLEEIPVS